MIGLVIVLAGLWLPGFASLPPMDRDEPRFAQASKQMLETGDFVDIRNGSEARNKKPVGIYWLQAAAVSAGEALGVSDARRQIWLYRLPSLAAAAAAVGFTIVAALAIVSWRGAWLAGLLLGATLLIGVEARLATTDAVVAATVAAGMAALSRVWLGRHDDRGPGRATILLFWAAVGVGILVKGPITPMVPALAIVALGTATRSWRWLARLRPLAGTLLCLLLVAPWFVLILLRTHGAFLSDSLGHDMMGKVAGGQEMHGAPPGTYLLAFFLSGWPLAPFAALAAPFAWRARRDPAVAFLLAWIVPSWIVFELVPTKLFHYVLPLYPALAILAVVMIERMAARRRERWSGLVLAGLLGLVPLLVGAAVPGFAGRLWTLTPMVAVTSLVALALSLGLVALAVAAWRAGAGEGAAMAGAMSAVPVAILVFGVLLDPAVSPALATSGRLVAAARAALGPACPEPAFATVWDREPSLMFLTGTDLLMTDPVGAARFLDQGACRAAFVGLADRASFEAARTEGKGQPPAAEIHGLAINGAKPLDIAVYVRH